MRFMLMSQRFNYIRWVQDLLDSTSDTYEDDYDPDRQVIGLDIGTGASCIFPLLGCAERPNWRFAATDIDEKNLEFARKNVISNNLTARIKLQQTELFKPLIPLDTLGLERIDFTICNPPFYASTEEMLSAAEAKARPPHSACTGAQVEMVTEGGEVDFITKLMDESLVLRDRCQWYTTMLGKLASLEEVILRLKKRGGANWAIAEFIQAGKTRRWGVAWSWGNRRPRREVARGISSGSAAPKHYLSYPPEVSFYVEDQPIGEVAQKVDSLMLSLDLLWTQSQTFSGTGFANGNVWSRAARRAKQRKKAQGQAEEPCIIGKKEECALMFKIELTPAKKGSVSVEIRWLRGLEGKLFESFCGMVKRQLTQE
ncbi:MAG: hypothetical protein Q9167_007436 [Letrouitia subvulpina]